MQWARRSVATTAVVALVLTALGGCVDSSNAADDDRIDTLTSYPLLETAPPGADRLTPVDVNRSENGIAVESSGASHRAALAWTTPGPIRTAGHFYADALLEQSWHDVRAGCITFPDGRINVVLTASRWEDSYQTTAGVDLMTDDQVIEVTVAVRAPFNDESGDKPTGAPPDLACLDDLPAEGR